MNVREWFTSSTRDFLWLAAAVAIAVGWYVHWLSWRTEFEAMFKEHVAMLKEQEQYANSAISEMKARAAEMTELQRRYEEEVKGNEEFRANFDFMLHRAVENVRRVHAEQA